MVVTRIILNASYIKQQANVKHVVILFKVQKKQKKNKKKKKKKTKQNKKRKHKSKTFKNQ